MSTQGILDIPAMTKDRKAQISEFKKAFTAAYSQGLKLADFLALPENREYKAAYEAYHHYRSMWQKFNGRGNPTREDMARNGDPELFGFEIHFVAMRVVASKPYSKNPASKNGRLIASKLPKGEATQRYTEMADKTDKLPADAIVAGLLGVSLGVLPKIRRRLTVKGYSFQPVRGGWKVAARPAPADTPAPMLFEQPRWSEADVRRMAREEAARLIDEIFGPSDTARS